MLVVEPPGPGGEILPDHIIELINDDNFPNDLFYDYCNMNKVIFNPDFLAKILIWLIENKHLEENK